MHLEVDNLTKAFPRRGGSLLALQNINLHVETGEFVCVVGASGSGKSTFLRLIAGLEMPTKGEILVDGVSVKGPAPDRGMVFQNYTLYPWMSVAENVGFGLKLQGVSRRQREQQVAYYLEIVGLSEFARSLPRELSGGMKQRVAIARALACQPKILLMDEPFGALDVQTKEVMQQFLLQIWDQTGTSILMITHDVEEAVFLSQRIYMLTARPGTVQEEIILDLPKERSDYLRRSAKFLDYKYYIMGKLRSDENVPLAV
ncbi:ABC transporter ATP-binding protein [Phormidium sp. CCY1219]|uniref:ABC transporter ATP-binding protein n=1 Tax=Phormidium sp. CCY1219 TaxID=2886104 RepID=UPI002D1F92E4|nr:ABC transporter ATP-binding protein [Phormidium sp. CCY1219]MEB3826164.1 ABC transporter ATP-binding protein [Phormidium sp. CCY1219]